MPIRILITGGTFDKEYDEIHARLVFTESHLPEMLRLGRCRLDVHVRTIMMIDSLDMSDADRDAIAQNCRQCEETQDRHHARHRHDGGDGARAGGAGQRARRSS